MHLSVCTIYVCACTPAHALQMYFLVRCSITLVLAMDGHVLHTGSPWEIGTSEPRRVVIDRTLHH